MSKEQETMDNFGGFNTAAEIDFFGDSNPTDDVAVETEVDPTVETKDENTEEGKKVTDKKVEKPDETEDIDFFGSADIEEDEITGVADVQGNEEKEDTNEAPAGGNISLLNQLKEKGLADFELEEGEELTEERAAEILEDSYEAKLESRLGEMLSELPPLTQDLIRFSIKGGDEKEFLSQLAQQSSKAITKDMDLDDEANQELVMRQHLEDEGHDEEYISSNIEFLKESGKIAGISKKVHEKRLAQIEKERAEKVKAQEKQARTMKENQRKFKQDLSDFLSGTAEVGPFKLTAKDKALASFIADPTEKTESGAVSKMQQALYNALQDKQKTVMLAKILEKDFDFSEIINTTKTKQTKKIQEDIRRTNAGKSSGSSRPQSKKSLADFFD